jgi:hypothetical protein
MTFKFTYAKHTYEYDYDTGYLAKVGGEDSFPYHTECCQVPAKLREQLDSFTEEQLDAIMSAVVQGYLRGVTYGKKVKIKEFKNMFDID